MHELQSVLEWQVRELARILGSAHIQRRGTPD